MKLEIKHLAPYLPHSLECKDLADETNFKLDILNVDGALNDAKYLNTIRLYLRPISDLSTLIKDEFEKYDGIRSGKADEEIINLFCEENGIDELIENIELKSLPYECVEYMFRNHYDFFGLIEQGLAISIHDVG